MLRHFFIIIVLFFSSCAVGPDYQRPELMIDENYLYENLRQSNQEQKEWWQKIDDPTLVQWINTLDLDNYSLKAATQRLLQAEARVDVQRGGFFPSLGIESSASRQQSVAGSFGALGSQIGGGTTKFFNNNYSLQARSSWQIDLFGKIRRSFQSAKASFQATELDQIFLRQTLIAELIRLRVLIANINAQINLANEIIFSRKQTLESIERRYLSGTSRVGAFDLRLAEENFHTAEAALPLLEANLKDAYYNLDLLLGRPPGATKAKSEKIVVLPAPDEIKIPQALALIDRRPDLLSHELRLVAATENVGVAVADLYPSISLTGSYGFQSIDSGSFIEPDQIVWQIAAALSNRLFEGGSLRANVNLTEARAKELEADYLQSILSALKEVESALVNEASFRKQYQKLKSSVAELKSAEKIASDRYSNGLLSINDFLDIQRRRAQVEREYLQSEFNIWSSRVDLYLALGGEWKFDKETK